MDYKEEIIGQMADRLYSQASSLVLSSMFVGSFGSAIIFLAIQVSTGLANGPCFPAAGFVVGGGTAKQVLIRAVGPTVRPDLARRSDW